MSNGAHESIAQPQPALNAESWPEPLPQPVTFEGAIALTQDWLDRLERGELSDQQFAAAVAPLVATIAGARGFFVAYLTGDGSAADRPSTDLVAGLAQSPDTVLELMIKNLAMSAAMEVTHDRAGDATMAERSRQTNQRSARMLQRLAQSNLGPQPVRDYLSQLHQAATEQTGPLADFLDKWGYDPEQRAAIVRAIVRVGL
ncbi:MAG: hypothetical protein EA001_04005 [Oscillatoriales cyanobacterium]|nr:MAG: hypothetical protein EA001_04005 [Oscillatoriales cyanobacterium]